MLNRPWQDPSGTDWTDALNPLAKPGFSQNNNPFAFALLKDPLMLALRLASGIEPRLFVCPDDRSRTIPAGQTIDFEAPIDPNTWLWALNASSRPNNTDFLFNITDSVTGASMFSQPVSMRSYNAAVTGLNNSGVSGNRGPLHLVKPHLYVPPSFPVVRIINTSDADLRCWVNLFCCVELP